MKPRRAFFLDRDGVLVADRGLMTEASQLTLLEGTAEALRRIAADFVAVVVTNQTVVARGLITEPELADLHRSLDAILVANDAPEIAAYYVCPHHPHADVPAYRVVCECRKPAPGLLLRAASDLHLSLADSFMVGDRFSDVLAGRRAGCRTVLVTSGAHAAPPIVGMEVAPPIPDFCFADLETATRHLLGDPA